VAAGVHGLFVVLVRQGDVNHREFILLSYYFIVIIHRPSSHCSFAQVRSILFVYRLVGLALVSCASVFRFSYEKSELHMWAVRSNWRFCEKSTFMVRIGSHASGIWNTFSRPALL
jgi:hypothetical protein